MAFRLLNKIYNCARRMLRPFLKENKRGKNRWFIQACTLRACLYEPGFAANSGQGADPGY